MKILFTGDWHLDITTSGFDLHEELVKSLERISESSHSVDAMIILGDIFHSSRPSPRAYKTAISFLRDLACPAYVISGNHDVNKTNLETALKPLKELKYQNVEFVDSGVILKIGTAQVLCLGYVTDFFCKTMYRCDPQEFLDKNLKIFQEEESIGKKIVVGHWAVEGLAVNSNGMLAAELGEPVIRRSLLGDLPYFGGHIHGHVQDKNVCLVGSPVAHNFGDSAKKGWVVAEF